MLDAVDSIAVISIGLNGSMDVAECATFDIGEASVPIGLTSQLPSSSNTAFISRGQTTVASA